MDRPTSLLRPIRPLRRASAAAAATALIACGLVAAASTTAPGDAFAQCTPALPDLTLDPQNSALVSVQTLPSGRRELKFPTSMRNAGTAPLILFPSKSYSDGTSDIRQRYVDCNGRTVNALIGRFTDDEGRVRLPHFVRARLRQRVLPGGEPGLVVAQTDLTGICIQDDYSWNSALPGWPSTAQFLPCRLAQQGISVGWMKYESPGYVDHGLDLGCVPPEYYWFELIIDPDNQIRELDESNNVVRTLVNLTSQPQPADPSVCTGPQVVGTLIGPDSLIAAAGAPTDSIFGRVWISGLTEPAGADPIVVAQVGYRLQTTFASDIVAWNWSPAQWLRQDGAEDVFFGQVTVPSPNTYDYAYRFSVFDGPWIYADFDGSLNGFSSARMGALQALSTTDVGDAALPFRLALEALTDPARGATRFRVSLPSASTIRLSIYDARGRLVKALEHASLPKGQHLVDWDGKDAAGRGAARGIYLARLETSDGARLSAKFFAITR